MNSTEGSPKELFESGEIYSSLEAYLNSSARSGSGEEVVPDGKIKAKASKSKCAPDCFFPNVAGFCRFLGVSTGELERLGGEYPEEYGRILAVLEDEALNSDLSPTLITAYLKRRLGYDSPTRAAAQKDQICISFEHDIIEDGE